MNDQEERTDPNTDASSRRSQVIATFVLIVLGLALVAAGIAAVFSTTNDVGSAALLTMGGLLFLLGAIGDRLESLRYGDLEVVLRRKADQARKGGDPETAQALERAADRIGARVKDTQRSYRTVRSGMPAGPERTARMEQIIREARTDAHDPDLDEERVLELLWTGSEGARVWALGVLQERPDIATVRSILEAVLRPDQMFDQYQALLLAERYLQLPDVRTWPRERIHEAVLGQLESGALGEDPDSHAVAQRILDHP